MNDNISFIRNAFIDVNIKDHPSIAVYRDAFTKLGINPNKYLSSIEALTKRILKGGEFPQINNTVDIGNAMCLKHIVPIGAHDIDKLHDDLELRFANEGDLFLPFGMEEKEKVDSSELVYVSGNTVKTRKWIWRQSDEGKITEESKNIFFPIDGFKGSNYNSIISARDELAKLLGALFNCEVKIGFIDKHNPSIEL